MKDVERIWIKFEKALWFVLATFCLFGGIFRFIYMLFPIHFLVYFGLEYLDFAYNFAVLHILWSCILGAWIIYKLQKKMLRMDEEK